MEMIRINPALLFLALSQIAAAHVEPPTNVSLLCHNLHNSVRWSYGQFSPGLKFKVVIGSLTSSSQELWVNAPTLHANFSLSDLSDVYLVTVTAVVGQNKSVSTPGIKFSYFADSGANRKCFLDFPPVNVTGQQDGSILLRFMHPSLLYKFPNRHKKRLLPFECNAVVSSQKKQHYSFPCVESVCEKELSVDPTEERHCVEISGVMQKLSFQATQEYCAQPFEQPLIKENNYKYIFIYIGVALLVLVVSAFVIFMVYKKVTQPFSSTPSAMAFTNRLKQLTFGLVQEQVLEAAEVGPISPTPLLQTTETETGGTTSSSPDLRARIGVSIVDEGVCDVGEVGNDDEEPGYVPGLNFDSSDEIETVSTNDVPSGYEKRPVCVKLAPDEEAEGYRG